MNIAVLYSVPTKRATNTPYVETDTDTTESAKEIETALAVKGATVTIHPIGEDHIPSISDIRADVIFNLIEWTGHDLPLADRAFAAIEQTGIPFTGGNRHNYMMTSDKVSMKKALDAHALPTARWQLFEDPGQPIRTDFRFPVIVKPALEHCSIGLSRDSIVSGAEKLRRKVREMIRALAQPMLIEEFITGREFQVTALEGPKGLRVLPPAEVVFDSADPNHMLTYASRWDENDPEYKSSHMKMTHIDQPLVREMERLTRRTFEKLGFRDYTRLDIRTRGNEVLILEANSNPGISDSDDYGMTLSYKAVGWTLADFVWEIVASAQRRGVKSHPPA